MKKILLVLTIAVFVVSCGNNVKKKNADNQGKETVTNTESNSADINLKAGDNVIENYANGKPHIIIKAEGNGDEAVAVYKTEYYETGQISKEGPMKDGKRSGEWKTYYKTGELWSNDFFVDGLADSTTTAYFKNGKIRYTGQFVKGKKSGVWKLFNENGALKEIKDYELK